MHRSISGFQHNKYLHPRTRDTCQGQEFGTASTPPRILFLNLISGGNEASPQPLSVNMSVFIQWELLDIHQYILNLQVVGRNAFSI